MKGRVGLAILVILSLLHSFAEVDGFQSSKQLFPVKRLRNLLIQSKSIAPLTVPKLAELPVLRNNPLFASLESASSNRQPTFLKRLWNVTFGWIVAWISRLLTALARKNSNSSSESPIESIAIMKNIAKEDEKKEVRDDVIIVSSSVPIPPMTELMTQASTAIPPKENSAAKDLDLARKLVEKKLKEIEEQRKQKVTATADLTPAVTAVSVNAVAQITTNIISSPEGVNPIIEKNSSELKTESFADTTNENIATVTLPDIAEEENPQIVEEPFADITSSESKIIEAALPIIETPTTVSAVSLSSVSDPMVNQEKPPEETREVIPSSSLLSSPAVSSASPSIFPASKFKFADFKSKGVSGVIAYTLTEAGFWAIYPLLIFFYKIAVGDSLDEDMTSGSTAQLIGLSAVFITIARFAVPLRFGLAFSLIPWVEENITQRYLKDFKFGGSQETTITDSVEAENNQPM